MVLFQLQCSSKHPGPLFGISEFSLTEKQEAFCRELQASASRTQNLGPRPFRKLAPFEPRRALEAKGGHRLRMPLAPNSSAGGPQSWLQEKKGAKSGRVLRNRPTKSKRVFLIALKDIIRVKWFWFGWLRPFFVSCCLFVGLLFCFFQPWPSRCFAQMSTDPGVLQRLRWQHFAALHCGEERLLLVWHVGTLAWRTWRPKLRTEHTKAFFFPKPST